MNTSFTTSNLILTALVSCCMLYSSRLFSQDSPKHSIFKSISITDSLLMRDDSLIFFSLYGNKKRMIDSSFLNLTNRAKITNKQRHYPTSNLNSKTFLKFDGGYTSFGTNYRSYLDTPYAEKDLWQENLVGSCNFIIAESLPLQASYLVHLSNSSFFRNIYDFQISLNPDGFRSLMQRDLKKRIERTAEVYEDSLKEGLLSLQQHDLELTGDWLKSSLQKQRILEAKEVLTVPNITYQPNLSKQENEDREKNIKASATKFIRLYQTVDSLYKISFVRLDSIKNSLAQTKQKLETLKNFGSSGLPSYNDYVDLKSQQNSPSTDDAIPSKYRSLLAIRALSFGRAPINYSDLSAKNVSINGINFEYNSWYYFAFTAGLLDIPFRDLSISNQKTGRQYLIMSRIGLGSLEKTNVIVSGFTGKKQLFTAPSAPGVSNTINLTGVSIEGRWRVNNNTSVISEVAQSVSPNFRDGSNSQNTKFDFSNHSNQAWSIKFLSYYPKSRTRIEGSYKITGENYQSFSSYQTLSKIKYWNVKADQNIFGKLVKLTAAIKTNDFTNPFVSQQYSSNTIFKSFGGSFRKNKWPTLSISYQPISQLTEINHTIVENRFQSLSTTSSHYYSIGGIKTGSTIVFNRFYNKDSDSAYTYFNAKNLYVAQNIFFSGVIANLAINLTSNTNYSMKTFDESLQFKVLKLSNILIGTRITSFNTRDVKIGGYLNSSLRLNAKDILDFSIERGFLPGSKNELIRNDMGTIQFTKYFG